MGEPRFVGRGRGGKGLPRLTTVKIYHTVRLLPTIFLFFYYISI